MRNMVLKNQVLLGTVNAGRDAFEALVKVTYQDAYTLAYRLTGNEEDARDVVQDAFLRAYRGLGRFRGEAQFTTWLYRIVANCASTSLTKRRRHRHDDIEEETGVADEHPESDPVAMAEAGSLRDRVSAAL